MSRTQTFQNQEIGLNVRSKLNSVVDWTGSYSYNINDVTHYGGYVYGSLVDGNIGNLPISTSHWRNLNTSASYAATASYAGNVPNTASYALQALSASWAPGASSDTASYALQAKSASWAPGASSGTASILINDSASIDLDGIANFTQVQTQYLAADDGAGTSIYNIYGAISIFALNGMYVYGSASFNDSVKINNTLENGGRCFAMGEASHAEGSATWTSVNSFTAFIIDGLAIFPFQEPYSDITSIFPPNTDVYIVEEGQYRAVVESSSYDGTSSFVQLTNHTISCGWCGIATQGGGDYWLTPSADGRYANGLSHAEGYQSKAPGNASHAEGFRGTTLGPFSHAEGNETTAWGNNAHAEGLYSAAKGNASHAEGWATVAQGDNAHSEGDSTQAIGNSSHAEGEHTIASGSYQLVVGKYNVQGNDTSLFVVGNGANDGARSDAFQVNQDGVYVSGSITASLLYGTSSWAESASWTKIALSSSYVSASYSQIDDLLSNTI